MPEPITSTMHILTSAPSSILQQNIPSQEAEEIPIFPVGTRSVTDCIDHTAIPTLTPRDKHLAISYWTCLARRDVLGGKKKYPTSTSPTPAARPGIP